MSHDQPHPLPLGPALQRRLLHCQGVQRLGRLARQRKDGLGRAHAGPAGPTGQFQQAQINRGGKLSTHGERGGPRHVAGQDQAIARGVEVDDRFQRGGGLGTAGYKIHRQETPVRSEIGPPSDGPECHAAAACILQQSEVAFAHGLIRRGRLVCDADVYQPRGGPVPNQRPVDCQQQAGPGKGQRRTASREDAGPAIGRKQVGQDQGRCRRHDRQQGRGHRRDGQDADMLAPVSTRRARDCPRLPPSTTPPVSTVPAALSSTLAHSTCPPSSIRNSQQITLRAEPAREPDRWRPPEAHRKPRFRHRRQVPPQACGGTQACRTWSASGDDDDGLAARPGVVAMDSRDGLVRGEDLQLVSIGDFHLSRPSRRGRDSHS